MAGRATVTRLPLRPGRIESGGRGTGGAPAPGPTGVRLSLTVQQAGTQVQTPNVPPESGFRVTTESESVAVSETRPR